MPDFFEEIKAVHWLFAFLTYLWRNLQLVMGCVIFAETSCYGCMKLLWLLKIDGGNARFFSKN